MSWSPAALLDPKAAVASPSVQTETENGNDATAMSGILATPTSGGDVTTGIASPAITMGTSHTIPQMTFQFTGPDGASTQSSSSDAMTMDFSTFGGFTYSIPNGQPPPRSPGTPVFAVGPPSGVSTRPQSVERKDLQGGTQSPIQNPGIQSASQDATQQNGIPSAPVNGASRAIEKLYNVQDRILVPQPKRRKTESDSDPRMNALTMTSTGVLGDGVRAEHRQQSEANLSALPRRRETVDLTGGDSNGEAQASRPIKDPSGYEEVCFGMLEGASINCHRVPAPKPGMVSINGNDYWPQVKVVLRRIADDETLNISVYDHTREVFGHVDAKTARALAPLLDSPLQIRTDCRIPSRRKIPGEIEGKAVSRNHSFELMLYGPRRSAVSVGRFLLKHGLNLISPTRVDPGVKVLNPHARENRLPAVARFTPAQATQYAPPAPVRSVEEIRAEVLGVFDSLPNSDDLPEADADDLIVTELLKHQRQALYFMTNRESDQPPNAGGGAITSTWRLTRDRAGGNIYHNMLTNQVQREPPPPTLGGILADMMGLGKTLSVLSLITKTLGEADVWSRLEPIQPRAPERKQAANPAKHWDMPKAQPLSLTTVRRNGKATLLICPLSTITNWEEQIKQHIKPSGITYHIYHGPNRIKDVPTLCQFDLVMTTYGSLSSELNMRVKGKRGVYPLEEIGWFRIVLDEAHMIREQNTLAFKSVCRLQANRRWAVTGTPVQNKLEDLASLLAFLRLKPFDERAKFLQHIIQPFKAADPGIVPKLRVLIDTITIRRLKDKIHLPPRTDEIVKLEFTPEERRIYDWFAKAARERVHVLTGQTIGQDRIVGGRTMIHILRSILQLRLICAHGRDLLSDDDIAELQGMTADAPIDIDSDNDDDKSTLQEGKAYEMLYLMQEGNSDNCSRCGNRLGANEEDDPESDRQDSVLGYMAPDYHVYCPACMKSLRSGQANPACGKCLVLDKSLCVELLRNNADLKHESRVAKSNKGVAGTKIITDDGYSGPHTKTRVLVQELLANKRLSEENPTEPPYKSVVFSGWTSHLDLIQIALDNAGITYTRLDGKMSRSARNAAMDAFRDDPSVQVILVSIMAGGLGLNLTAGNSVYVMEPQFNPAAEAQAVDRVHRLGQKRPVRTVRFVMNDSFEEKMIELQEKKKKLASLSMDRDSAQISDKTDAARQRLMDLRSLFK